MFKANFSAHNKIWVNNKDLRNNFPRTPPVSAGLGRTVFRKSSTGAFVFVQGG